MLSGTERGAAAPGKGMVAPPRHRSIGKEATKQGQLPWTPILCEGGLDGWVSEFVGQGRLLGFQSNSVPLLGLWPF